MKTRTDTSKTRFVLEPCEGFFVERARGRSPRAGRFKAVDMSSARDFVNRFLSPKHNPQGLEVKRGPTSVSKRKSVVSPGVDLGIRYSASSFFWNSLKRERAY